jgi:hypothetical protein
MSLSIPNNTVNQLSSKPGKSNTGFRFNRLNIYNHSQRHGNNITPNNQRKTLEELHAEYNTKSPYLAELYKPKPTMNNLMKLYYKFKDTKEGGGPMPLRYFNQYAEQSSADPGSDILGVSGNVVRPAIGGTKCSRRSRRTKRSNRRTRTKGGFFPSIMEPFVLGCSKYIAPLAGLSAWKLMNRPTKRLFRKSGKKTF